MTDKYRYLKLIVYKKESQSLMLQPHDFIKVTLRTIQFHDGDTKIKAIGFIDDMATEEEKKKFYLDQYKETDVLVDYEKYTTSINIQPLEEEEEEEKIINNT